MTMTYQRPIPRPECLSGGKGEHCQRVGRDVPYRTDMCRSCWLKMNDPWWATALVTPKEIVRAEPEIDCCGGRVVTIKGGPVTWAYGVTTVPQREELLAKTLARLARGGFDQPQLFVERGLGPFGTWWMSLVDLWVSNPEADRFAIFQDDVSCVTNLRQYLDRIAHPEMGYWNLFTTRENEKIIRGKEPGKWYESALAPTDPPDARSTQQTGRGALGLVFPRRAVVELLTSRHLVERPMDGEMGRRGIDGCVVTAMNKAGYREYVHAPSLLQHEGEMSSTISWKVEEQLRQMGARRERIAKSFPGENFDALTFLEKKI